MLSIAGGASPVGQAWKPLAFIPPRGSESHALRSPGCEVDSAGPEGPVDAERGAVRVGGHQAEVVRGVPGEPGEGRLNARVRGSFALLRRSGRATGTSSRTPARSRRL